MENFDRLCRFLSSVGHLAHSFFLLIAGIWKISKLKHAPVSIFGSARLTGESNYMKEAHHLAHLLIDAGIPVLSGGGAGIMQAATCGGTIRVHNKTTPTIGIGVKGLEPYNKCAHDFITQDYFFARKWLLTTYSAGFVVFPGGFGTVDELAEVLVAIQTKNLTWSPICLVGVDYWQPFIDWVYKRAIPEGTLTEKEAELIYVSDNIQEIFSRMVMYCKNCAPLR